MNDAQVQFLSQIQTNNVPGRIKSANTWDDPYQRTYTDITTAHSRHKRSYIKALTGSVGC